MKPVTKRVIEITGLVAGVKPSIDTVDYRHQVRVAKDIGYCRGMDKAIQRRIVRCPAMIPAACQPFAEVLHVMRWFA